MPMPIELRRHTENPLAPWARAQHAQGLCESWVGGWSAGKPAHACRNRAVAVAWSPSRRYLLHLCGVHIKPVIAVIARQHEGAPTKPGVPDGMKWRSMGGAD